ncbi:MAG: hypothetical protein ACKODX_20490 [Gemmata sp.]
MATVACPGCGLPRAEAEVRNECPVCQAAPAFVPPAPPRRARPADPDPTAGLPADASELGAAPAVRPPARGGRLVLGAVLFALGGCTGAAGVLAWQAFAENPSKLAGAVKTPHDAAPAPPASEAPKVRGPAVAPVPHEPAVARPAPEPAPAPRAVAAVAAAPSWQVTTIDVGQHPPDVYTLPFPLKSGQHVVLRGKVKALRVSALDAGAILDASQLEVGSFTISGKIDAGSTLKVNAPGGTVHIGGKVDAGSRVEVHAPGGEVKFLFATTGAKEGSKIDNGARVSITARTVEFKGDIGGTGTKVSVVLTRNAWLKVASVSGKATVEYQSQAGGWSPPDVAVGPVGPDATFRKAGE